MVSNLPSNLLSRFYALNFKKFVRSIFIFNFLLQRMLTYNYSISYSLREKIYRAINIWNSKLNKYIFIDNKNSIPCEISIDLLLKGVVLNICDVSPSKASYLLDSLSSMSQKKVKSPDSELQKVVYSQSDLASNYDFLSLASSQRVVDISTKYFGVPPVIAYLSAWKTFASCNKTNEMFFHMDHHGHKFLKLFYYLNDVEIGGGHHEYCHSTHRQDAFDKLILDSDNNNKHFKNAIYCKRKFGGGMRLDEHLVHDFIPEHLLKVGGQAGTSFIEDTRGLHRGTLLPAGHTRTIFQVLYVPNIIYKDRASGFAYNEALANCFKSSGLHPKIFERLFSNVFIDSRIRH